MMIPPSSELSDLYLRVITGHWFFTGGAEPKVGLCLGITYKNEGILSTQRTHKRQLLQ